VRCGAVRRGAVRCGAVRCGAAQVSNAPRQASMGRVASQRVKNHGLAA